MSIHFSLLQNEQAILIKVSGRTTTPEVAEMRRRTVELQNETRISRYVVDLQNLASIDDGSVFDVHHLGERFSDTGFSPDNVTAVILPANVQARRQVEFMHTVEINRGRGSIKYVQNVDDALTWLATQH